MTRRNTSEALRAFAEQEASALFTGELARRQDEWRGALASAKHTLADLEATCDSVMSAAPDAPTDAVSELIEKIVAAAAADAETLAQQVEADARAEVAEAQALVDRLQAEVRAGQEQLRRGREELDVEQAARVRAESALKRAQVAHEHALKDAQVAHEQARAALEAQLRSRETEVQSIRGEMSALHERLAAGQAERANLTATLGALQSAVHGAVSTLSLVQPEASTPRRGAPHADAVEGDATPVPVSHAPVPSAAPVSSRAQATSRAAIREVPPAELAPSIGGYVTALLETIEASYRQDIESELPPAHIVKRLTDNLRYASHLFAERLGRDAASESWVLKEEIAKLLHATSATSFGRDLAIAAREAERHERHDRRAGPQGPDEASA